MNEPLPARLVLADGRVFHGRSFGAHAEVVAEVVFNTAHTGYQEVLTDPSYRFEAVVFTVPILGIYGVPDDQDDQSRGAQASAIICREVSRRASNHRSKRTLPEHLEAVGVPGIEHVDTRGLTKHLRDHGSQNGIITTSAEPDAALVAKVKAAPSMDGLDLAKEVTTKTAYKWEEPFRDGNDPGRLSLQQLRQPGTAGRVVVVDFGIKFDILRHLASRGLDVTVVPARTTAEEVLEREPDGVLLSNGPGDPAAVTYGIEAAKRLIASCGNGGPPVYGVCLGHQILSLASGARTHHLKFGHRGGNHPVRDHATGKVLITSHNHGFAVDPSTLGRTAMVPTYTSLFDGTIEGIRHQELPVAAVQFHPEAGPGPHEAAAFFDDFVSAVTRHRGAPSRPAGARA
jgi:carbamoyl-phosphate synthase small subunit